MLNSFINKVLIIALSAVCGSLSVCGQCSVRDSVLIIGPATKQIADYAYADNNGIAKIEASGATALQSIGEYAFLGCKNLREVNFPASLKTLGEGALRECSSLQQVKLPAGVEVLPKAAFAWCSSLRSVSLPKTLKDIGSLAFAYCGKLSDIALPQSITHIGLNVFSKCESLESMVLPRNLKELESYVFSDCTSLKYVCLPANGNLLGELIFTGCTNLQVIDAPSTVVPKFDCDSFPFDPDDTAAYSRCILRVPETSVRAYLRAHGWELFRQIDILLPTEY